MIRRRVYFVTLGCPKNQVDSEIMLGQLSARGHEFVMEPGQADVLVVNTCAFIGPAKEESIETILDLARVKAEGEGRRLVVTGCLAQRYADDLQRELPEVDVFVGTGDLMRIAEAVEGNAAGAARVYRGAQHVVARAAFASRVRTGNWWSAYLKVSEGCDHTCSFCIIPKIRGRHESRPMGDIVAEAERLASEGALELNLIAQDLTAYGRDLAGDATLARLLRALAVRVPALRWLRCLYAYPSSVTDELLEVMATEPAVVKYLDLPLQHISDRMLRAMRRERSGAQVRKLLARTRAAVPGIALRSSFIVGFPGETEGDVTELCAFLAEARFARAGVFQYSQEENTAAAELPGQIPDAVKTERYARVMAAQASVAAAAAAEQVGQRLEVIVESEGADGRLVGRTATQAPEIDGVISLAGRAAPGDMVTARVTAAQTYDLSGEILIPTVDTPRASP